MSRTAAHPCEQLAANLSKQDMSAAELGRQTKVPANRITEIMNKQRVITRRTALGLDHSLAPVQEYWLNLQATYNLRLAEARVGADIKTPPTFRMRKKKPASQQAATAC